MTIMNKIKVAAAVLVICFTIYYAYRMAKAVSYSVFHEPMVEQTIREMVKPEYLL